MKSSKRTTRFQRLVLTHLRQMRGGLGLAALCTLGYTLAELLAPWPLKLIFDYVLLGKAVPASFAWLSDLLAQGKTTAIVVLSLGILIVAASKGAFAYTQLYLTSRIGHQMVYTLRRELFAHLQRLSLSFHHRTRSGELLTKVTSDTNTLKDVFADAALSMVTQVLTLTGMFVVLFLLNWRLSLIAMLTFPVLVYSIFTIYRRVKQSARQQREREGRLASRISETLGSTLLVRAFAREQFEQKRFDDESTHNLQESIRTSRMEAGAARAVEVINAVGLWAAVLFGALLVVKGSMSPGDVLIFTAYLTNMYKPLRNLAKLSTQFSRAQVSAERISQILAIEPEDAEEDFGYRVNELRGDITFEQVSFGYDDKQYALRTASFHIEPGQRVALVGASGAGKSTIASLLLGFYQPQSGTIWIDNMDAAAYHRPSLRRAIGVVLQDNILFGASIGENIAYGKPEASKQEIEAAARLASAHEFIAGLADGYDTIIGERGCTLSGGQRQRLCLARALIKRPSILILDEPTAAVDAASATLMQQAIERVMRGRTTILIAHHFHAMESFDQIIVLKEGGVVEIGKHPDLLARRGYYAELHRLQGLSVVPEPLVNKAAKPVAPEANSPASIPPAGINNEGVRVTQTYLRSNLR